MKKIAVLLPGLMLAALPLAASAHEVATYKINGSMYQIVIGSLNEPLVVDDKTGLDLMVNKCFNASCMASMSDDGDMDGPAGTPVVGLEQNLQLELIAGTQKKSLSVSAQYGKDGAYTAPFYPTVATTFSYHVMGKINNTPVDLTFTCLPEGTPKSPLDTTQKQLSDSVTQMSVSGGFGCPLEKAGMGFPEESASINSLEHSGSSTTGTGLAIAALAIAVVALVRTKRS